MNCFKKDLKQPKW